MSESPDNSLQPSKWADADFESLSWHDCTVHSIGLDQNAGEYQCDLLLDLDFLVEWILVGDGTLQFRVAPALLRFCGVDKLAIHTRLDYMQPMQISEVTRSRRDEPGQTNYHWTIKLHTYPGRENQIEFDALCFSQQLTGRTVVTGRQSLSSAERRELIRTCG